ncbi:MAG: serine/threonine protein kinase [Rhodanobacteraceae bacterium]|nr:serine/threonine protein kinase [Rhodanobacteraceae bacterium]
MRRALEIACAALDEPESERRYWAESQCGQDADLRREVLALLAADESPDELLRGSKARVEPRDPWPGRLIGRYRVGERIGSGGMGTVYRAQPESGVGRRPVALKLIKRGMDSEEVLRRFLQERDILARLDHPNIARLLDGGMTADERPWFAMELIAGEPLLAWCDRRELPLRQRIELLQICAAVAYAHQNLVVHRDIKPGNVLVTADGQVKLLDFGIAKLIDADGDAVTRSVIALMTPDYAAPEQLQRGPITTQTDVYLLGLLLFELLTGLRWESGAATAGESLPRLQAAFSGRHARQDPQRIDLAARRRCSVPVLARQLTGDLERIARRALATRPDERYASVTALADDLNRHLRGEAVLAREGDWRYRLGRFVWRHRMPVAASLAVLLALAVGVVATLRESARLRIAEARLETSLTMLEDVFLGADPYLAKGGDTRATDLLAGVRERLQNETELPPALAARLWSKLGSAYVSLDEREQAEAALQRVLTLAGAARSCRTGACVDSDPEGTAVLVAAAQARLAHFRLVLDRQDDALPSLQQAISTLRDSGPAGRLPLADALSFLNDYELVEGRYEALDARNLEIIGLVRSAAGDVAAQTIMVIGVRASTLRATGHSDLAEAPAAEAMDLARRLGEQTPAAIRLYAEQQYAGVLTDLGRSGEAEPVLQHAFQRAVALRGLDSVIAQGLGWELANAHAELGRFELARDEYRQLLAHSGPIKSANVAAVHNALGLALLANGESEAGASELEQAAEVFCASDASTPPCIAITLNRIEAALRLDQRPQAEAWLNDMRDGALALGGRAATRWHLLAARRALLHGDLSNAGAELALSQRALPDGAGPIDQARWLEQEAALAEAGGKPDLAVSRLRQAEALYQSRWVGTAFPLRQIQADLERLQSRAQATTR